MGWYQRQFPDKPDPHRKEHYSRKREVAVERQIGLRPR